MRYGFQGFVAALVLGVAFISGGVKAQAPTGLLGPTKDILFDTKGVAFGPWLNSFVPQVKQHWNVPVVANSQKGHTIVQFNVHRDGSITDLIAVGPSGNDAFDRASLAALSDSNPTAPLPKDYPSEQTLFMVTFHYND